MTPGSRIGRYELVSPLGEGGTGEVWEAVLLGPHGFRKPVALKVLREGVDPGENEGLFREARYGAMLAHPNVVAVHELGNEDGRWFVAMELVRGASVAELANGALPPAAVLDVGVQVCAALRHVHAVQIDGRGLVHRDVKPENLMVDRSGLVKLADLGIARLAGGPGDRAATPGYAPPEQLAGREEPRSDLFAVGAMLFRLAVGTMPFGHGQDGLRGVQTVERRLADPTFLAPVDSAVPGLGDVVRRCLRAEPKDRWPDAGAALAALVPLRERVTPHPTLLELLESARPGMVGDQSTAPTRPATTLSVETWSSVPPPRRLPPVTGPLVGRRAEVDAALAALRAEGRWITLLGAGGSGKTRVALEVVCAVGAVTVAWCELANTRPDELEGAVLQATSPGDERTVADRLAARAPIVLVLDGAEGVAAALAERATAWLAAAPGAAILATSRVRLHAAAEHVVTLGPLPIGDGVALFEALAPGPIPPEERADVERLVSALDGLPLAIGLAARRTRVLRPRELLTRLDERWQLLADGTATGRHRSLYAAVEASWDLLDDVQRSALAQLSVLVGDFSPEAAEAVLDLSGIADPPWPLDVLGALVDASLVEVVGRRLRLSSAVRAFAAGHLDDRARAAAELRHGAFFALPGTPELYRSLFRRSADQLRERTQDLANLQAALARAEARRDGPMVAALALAMADALRGFSVDAALASLTRAFELAPPDRQVDLLLERVICLDTSGRSIEAQAAALEALRVAHSPGHRITLLLSLAHACARARRVGDALTHATQALREALAARDAQREAAARYALGVFASLEERLEDAEIELRRALDGFAAVGDLRSVVVARTRLGSVLLELDRPGAGRAELERALGEARRIGDISSESVIVLQLGRHELMLGRPDRARPLLEEALHTSRIVGRRTGQAAACHALGVEALARGRLDEARSWAERAAVLSKAIGRQNPEETGLAAAIDFRTDPARARARLLADPRPAHATLECASVVLATGNEVHAQELLVEALGLGPAPADEEAIRRMLAKLTARGSGAPERRGTP